MPIHMIRGEEIVVTDRRDYGAWIRSVPPPEWFWRPRFRDWEGTPDLAGGGGPFLTEGAAVANAVQTYSKATVSGKAGF